MVRRIISGAGAALLGSLWLSSAVSGQSLAITPASNGYGYGYAQIQWNNFTSELNARFESIQEIPDLSDLNQMLQFDSLMVQLPDASRRLSPDESANLTSYIETGRKVLIFGENDFWGTWNDSILSVVGGAFTGEWTGAAVVVDPYPLLNDNVSSVETAACGVVEGGIVMFDVNHATVWEGSGAANILTIFEVNTVDDARWNSRDNAQWTRNVVEWLAQTGTALRLEVGGSCPGTLTATVSGATPNRFVAFIYASNPGAQIIPGNLPCAGLQLGLDGTARLVGTARADADGVAVLSGNIPAAACGGYMQAIDIESCGVTNVEGV